MTDNTDVVNLALQEIGTRTTVTSLSENSNEAIQASLVIYKLRDQLLRMAPWNCAFNFANLAYITSVPGTPENTTAGSTTWAKGIPAPPWVYEYQYPYDCIKPCFVVPQFVTGFASAIPITTAITGGAPSFWQGPPIKYKVSVDQFFAASAATVAVGGSGYAVGDQITLEGTATGSDPIGAPAVVEVATAPAGVVATVTMVPNVFDSTNSGSYFSQQTNPVAQGTTTGSGSGATFNLTYAAKGDQRVILTNQEYALLGYVKRVTDPNVMDPLFLEAWIAILGARLAPGLTGDKAMAKMLIEEANLKIQIARVGDGNEGLTVNDVTPDWIRARGMNWNNSAFSPTNMVFDWGPLFASYS